MVRNSLRRWRRRARRGSGQSIVEFAVVLPIFLLMLFGLVDLGRLVYANSTLSQAARESARLAAVEAYWVGEAAPGCNQPAGPVCPADEAELRGHVLVAANRMMVGVGSIDASDLHIGCTGPSASPPSGAWTSPPSDCSSPAVRKAREARVSVRIAMDFQPMTPLIAQIFSSLSLSGSATMTIN